MTNKAFLPFLKCVGTGPKRNRDLTKEEMRTVMRAFLKEEVIPEQIAAFLLGWRVKGESLDEFAAAIEVFDEFVQKSPLPNSIEFGYPYDGKVKNPYLFPLTAKYLETFDINFSLHGGLLQPAKCGTTLKEICDNVALPKNVYYYDREKYFPELYAFSQIREKLGLRSSFNTIEKLLNITESETAVIGAFHKPFVDKYIELFRHRYKKLVIIKGNEGTPEIFSKCALTIVEGEKTRDIKVNPQDYGIDYKKSIQRISLTRSLEMTQDPIDDLKDLARFNAAVLLFLSDRVSTIEEGLNQLT